MNHNINIGGWETVVPIFAVPVLRDLFASRAPGISFSSRYQILERNTFIKLLTSSSAFFWEIASGIENV